MAVDLGLSAYAFNAHWFIAVDGDLPNKITQMVGTCAQAKSDQMGRVRYILRFCTKS